MQNFKTIYQRAAKRKGGEDKLQAMLPQLTPKVKLAKLQDSYCLCLMSKCIFRSGFVWRVVENKWQEISQAFHNFEPDELNKLGDEQWYAYANDPRIIRNMTKVFAIRDNLALIQEYSAEHQGFARFIAQWPEDDLVGLFIHLKKNFKRLGGMTGQYFLAFLGKDSFILTKDVVLCLQEAGVNVADMPGSQRDLRLVQEAFNTWHKETKLPYRHLSAIMALSVGVNYLE